MYNVCQVAAALWVDAQRQQGSLAVLQQQDQLNAMSVLTAYLRETQAQQQPQTQQPTHPHTDSLPTDRSWPSAMSERQQLAFRSLSEAAVDPRFGLRCSSEMVRASLQAPTTSSFPGDIIQSQGIQNPHLSATSTAGMSLAQQSLLYAPSQQQPTPLQMFQQAQFSPQTYSSRNPFGSGRSSLEQGFRSSDPGRRPSFSNPDWMSSASGPSRYSTGSGPASSRFSQDLGGFFSAGRRSSMGVKSGVHNSFDLDWAGRPIVKPETPSVRHNFSSWLCVPWGQSRTSCLAQCCMCMQPADRRRSLPE